MRPVKEKKAYDKLLSGMRIREARENIGIKAIDLAMELGISVTQMSRIENGSSGCTIDTLMQIADELSVSVDYLLCRDGKEERNPRTSDYFGVRKAIEQKLDACSIVQLNKIDQMIDLMCN